MSRFTERDVVELMRDGSRCLTQMHTRRGMKWFLVPGGEVKDDVAQALLTRSDIQPSDDGLFPGINQTYTFRVSP
jgi:hypothetical protein